MDRVLNFSVKAKEMLNFFVGVDKQYNTLEFGNLKNGVIKNQSIIITHEFYL